MKIFTKSKSCTKVFFNIDFLVPEVEFKGQPQLFFNSNFKGYFFIVILETFLRHFIFYFTTILLFKF